MRTERKDDVVAGLDILDPRPVLEDDPGRLVPEHHRERQRPIPVHDVPVAHTDAGGLDPDANLFGFGRILIEIEDLEGFVDLRQNCSAHVVLLWPEPAPLDRLSGIIPHTDRFRVKDSPVPNGSNFS